MTEKCVRCTECSMLLYDLHKALASILPLVSNQESFEAKAVRYCINEIKKFQEKKDGNPHGTQGND